MDLDEIYRVSEIVDALVIFEPSLSEYSFRNVLECALKNGLLLRDDESNEIELKDKYCVRARDLGILVRELGIPISEDELNERLFRLRKGRLHYIDDVDNIGIYSKF
jgi:hypothetical protein